MSTFALHRAFAGERSANRGFFSDIATLSLVLRPPPSSGLVDGLGEVSGFFSGSARADPASVAVACRGRDVDLYVSCERQL
jgi:hypothetical protein